MGIEGKGTFFPSNPKRNYIGERATMQSIHAPSERRDVPEKGGWCCDTNRVWGEQISHHIYHGLACIPMDIYKVEP